MSSPREACSPLTERGARWRYHQDDDLHRFARELLVEHGEEDAAFDRLADAVRAALPDDARGSPAGYRDAITDMLGSIRSLFGAAMQGQRRSRPMPRTRLPPSPVLGSDERRRGPVLAVPTARSRCGKRVDAVCHLRDGLPRLLVR